MRKLREIQQKTGRSLAQVLRQHLGLQLAETRKAYNKGYRDGFGRFQAPCSVCAKPMDFNPKVEGGAEAKKALLTAFAKWAHTPCLKRGR